MTSRAKQANTAADEELHRCLNANPPTSFMMVAGAGSGKTTSLIKGLAEILSSHGPRLKRNRQRVACVTYTEIAAGEIWADVGNNPLVHVSTIHSFLWTLLKPFQTDIQRLIAGRIKAKIVELEELARNFGPRVQQKTKEKNQREITRYQQLEEVIGRVRHFGYGTGSDYANGILGHDDVLKLGADLIRNSPLMRRIVAQQFPFLFVDESQDTSEEVVAALRSVDREFSAIFCLGFFGDPMQKIYATGIGDIALEEDWRKITKPENFRCPASILQVANAIRRGGDGLVQTRGRMSGPADELHPVEGTANIFVLPSGAGRDALLGRVRAWMSVRANDPLWIEDAEGQVKVLVIVHRMAAKRLGFGDLYAALNDGAPDRFKNGFMDGTAWPLRPFVRMVLPLVKSWRNGDEFGVMEVLRRDSPLMSRDGLIGIDVARRLTEVRQVVNEICDMFLPHSQATIANVLQRLLESSIFKIEGQLFDYLQVSQGDAAESNTDSDEDADKESKAMEAFLRCPANQLVGYYRYLNDESPYSTQQGIKGAEFERVLVVLDDEEGTHTQFSYEKLFGVAPLSARDEANIREGKETVVERTRRLFYVCCTRALKDLAVVFFASDVAAARQGVVDSGIFPAAAIHSQEHLPDAG
jgi:DNA helicase II / ATP-dependent DNA helicase PcrA